MAFNFFIAFYRYILMTLPPLITTAPEGRRVYPCDLIINNQKLTRLIIDPHFEEKHSSYVNDELIQQLNNRTLFPTPPKEKVITNISLSRIFKITR